MTFEQTAEILKPQTQKEKLLLKHPAVIEGLWWGKPRPGHDEGEVIKHITQILHNIDHLSFKVDASSNGSGPSYMAVAERGSELWERLRLIAIVHDTFKYQVDPKQPKNGENHHATRARRFAEQNFPQFFNIPMLEIIELHDDAYNAWCKGSRDNRWDKAKGPKY